VTAELRHLLEGLLLVIGALLLIVNLLGTAPVFLALTGNVDDATRTNLARKVAINGFVLLLYSATSFDTSSTGARRCDTCSMRWSIKPCRSNSSYRAR